VACNKISTKLPNYLDLASKKESPGCSHIVEWAIKSVFYDPYDRRTFRLRHRYLHNSGRRLVGNGNFSRRSREPGFINCFFIEINKSLKTTLSQYVHLKFCAKANILFWRLHSDFPHFLICAVHIYCMYLSWHKF